MGADFARSFSTAPFFFVLGLAACGGGGGAGSASPTPQGKPVLSVATVQITSVASPVTVTISETGYAGSFSVSASACAGIASITSPGPSAYTIAGIGAGQCAVSFTDSFGQSVALPVSVTISNVVAK